MGFDLKGIVLKALFSRWGPPPALAEGYSVILATPMDMPFLLRYALEGLRGIDTTHCNQILVIPDGWGDDRGRGLRRVIEAAGDPRVELVELRRRAQFFIHSMKKSVLGAANSSHWAMIVEGVAHSRSEYAFLHDADAFFIDGDGLERQYAACRDRGMVSLGVESRWDPFFLDAGYAIPGTWELMFSTSWARRRDPTTLKGRWRDTPRGRHEFDTMLYPHYLDYPGGKIGVLDPPPRFVHFSGAVTTYRSFRYEPRPKVVDELFRLLALSLLEEILPDAEGRRALPGVAELARGLDDPDAPVTYGTDRAAHEYPIFRKMIEDLCEAPIVRGERAERLRTLVSPFDEHFERRTALVGPPRPSEFQFRRHAAGMNRASARIPDGQGAIPDAPDAATTGPGSVLIVIVNYRTPGLTVDCLRSLRDEVAAAPGARVVVTDNASGDDSVARIEAAVRENGWGAWVSQIPLDRNGGFAAGNNAAIRPALAADRPPDYVLLLNPDTVVRPGALGTLLRFMDARPDVGIAGGRLEEPDGTPQASGFRFHTVLSELEGGLRLGPATRALSRWVATLPEPAGDRRVDWVSGACLVVRRAVFEAVGLLDEGYFMYYEEVDFCRRASRAGWPCWQVPGARVVHLIGQSSGIGSRRRLPAYWFRSRRLYLRTHLGAPRAVLADLAWALGFATFRVRQVLQRKPDNDPPRLWRDFLRHSVLNPLGRSEPSR